MRRWTSQMLSPEPRGRPKIRTSLAKTWGLSPRTKLSSVDLPEPFGPTTAQLSPARTVQSTFRKIGAASH